MSVVQYLPAGLLVTGAVLSMVVGTPQPTPLERPLAVSVPTQFLGLQGTDVPIDADEEQRSGVTEYINRAYDVGAEGGPILLYVGYHATQQGENRMHSPSLCLPGAGWTPVESRLIPVAVGANRHMVNRYVLQKGAHRILVYYWFQGRGRVTAGETALKVHSLVDALFSGRDEEALARIVVPYSAGENKPVGNSALPADTLAMRFAAAVIPTLAQALPPAP